jgi:hypothetical protein
MRPSALPYKVQWEWRRVKHSFGTKRRNRIIEDLRHCNEDLRRSLEQTEVPGEDDGSKVKDLKRRFNIQHSNSIRQCLSSLHRALESRLRCACSPPHQAAIDLDWSAYDSIATRTFKVAVSYRPKSSSSHTLDSWRRLHVTPEATNMVESVPNSTTPTPPRTEGHSSTLSFRDKVTRFKSVGSTSQLPTPPAPPATPKANCK